MDFVIYILLRLAIAVLNLLPLSARIVVVTFLVKTVFAILPRYKKIARRNLDVAFPEKSESEKAQILSEACVAFARLFVDFARLHAIDAEWVESHVNFPFLERARQLRSDPSKGMLVVTGHLGSFELFSRVVAIRGFPVSFIVRAFKLKRVDEWWKSIREQYGNHVISRKGAFKEVNERLASKEIVAVLFDQNVTRNHAIFVDFFGRKAATTKLVALAALKAEPQVVVSSLTYAGNDKYEINVHECDFANIYSDTTLSLDDKVYKITQSISDIYESMIRKHPGEWFWYHRRWKTTPEGEKEDLYD